MLQKVANDSSRIERPVVGEVAVAAVVIAIRYSLHYVSFPSGGHYRRKANEYATRNPVESSHDRGVLHEYGQSFATDGIDKIPADFNHRKSNEQDRKLQKLGLARVDELRKEGRCKQDGFGVAGGNQKTLLEMHAGSNWSRGSRKRVSIMVLNRRTPAFDTKIGEVRCPSQSQCVKNCRERLQQCTQSGCRDAHHDQ